MVVGAGPLEHLLERLQVLVGEEGRSIHAREHLAVGVPAPVRTGHRLELERLDPLRAGGVRAAAQVGERAVGIERDGGRAFVLDQVFDQLHLVRLLLQMEALKCVLHADVLAHERLVGVDVLLHRRLDPREVLVVDHDPIGEVEVVVEAVLDRWADADLHARIELEHRGGEDVRRVVAHELEGLLPAALGEDLELGRVGAVLRRERAAEITKLPIHLDRQGRAGQPRTDGGGGVGAGGAVFKAQGRPVGQLVIHPGPDASPVASGGAGRLTSGAGPGTRSVQSSAGAPRSWGIAAGAHRLGARSARRSRETCRCTNCG